MPNEYEFDKNTEKWKKVKTTKGKRTKKPSSSNNKDTKTTPQTGENSQKDMREIEKYTICGDADIEPETSIKARKTVSLQGFGSNVSGIYYVDQVKRSWGKDGFSESLSVSKAAVGDSLKQSAKQNSDNTSRRKKVTPKKKK
jgi:hypothetical protein